MNNATSAYYPFKETRKRQQQSWQSPQGLNDIDRSRSHRAVLEIDLGAICNNAQLITQYAGGAKLMAVVKRDAYGLGARPIAQALRSVNVQAFAVDNVAEGLDLRDAGITEPILIIDGDVSENAPLAITHDLIPGIPHEELLLAYDRAAAGESAKYPVWLVINVGFNRSGYRNIEDFTRFVRRAQECENLEVKAVYAHLTNSNAEADINLAQIEEFDRLVKIAKQILGEQLETSLFASHSILRWGEHYPTNWVRPGIILYGVHLYIKDLVEQKVLEIAQKFQPAISLKARITGILEFTHSEAIGYGQKYTTEPGQRLATVAIGFGSGYPFRSSQLETIIHGHGVPLFGDVGMDALQIDITHCPNVAVNDWVTLIGQEGQHCIEVQTLANLANTSPYQLLSGINCYHSYYNFGNHTS
jgi:alanine racemase